MNLARMYAEGLSTLKNLQETIHLYEGAAEAERCPVAAHCHGRPRSYFDKSPLSARDRFFDRALGKPAQKLCHPRRF
jgi:TPR repeat protein